MSEVARFGAVGISAMLVHFFLVAALLVPAGLSPLIANSIGFLVAFQVSYQGHYRLTFKAEQVPHRIALPRFFAVACIGFAANELMYFMLLRYTPIDYRVALLFVLLAVAALTFFMGKLWAFAKPGDAR
jgi:putative flippase GtrA